MKWSTCMHELTKSMIRFFFYLLMLTLIELLRSPFSISTLKHGHNISFINASSYATLYPKERYYTPDTKHFSTKIILFAFRHSYNRQFKLDSAIRFWCKSRFWWHGPWTLESWLCQRISRMTGVLWCFEIKLQQASASSLNRKKDN